LKEYDKTDKMIDKYILNLDSNTKEDFDINYYSDDIKYENLNMKV